MLTKERNIKQVNLSLHLESWPTLSPCNDLWLTVNGILVICIFVTVLLRNLVKKYVENEAPSVLKTYQLHNIYN